MLRVHIVLADFAEYIKKICNSGVLLIDGYIYMLNFFLRNAHNLLDRFEESTHHLKGIPKTLFLFALNVSF
jgi:hypothetical protein